MRLGLANCDGPKTRANEPWEVSSNEVEDCLPPSRYSTCMSVLPSLRVPARSDAMRRARTGNVDATLMGNESWPEPVALTSLFSVELPGIEPELPLGKMHSELLFRSVWFRFSPALTCGFVFGS
jgi:hypothetical protein